MMHPMPIQGIPSNIFDSFSKTRAGFMTKMLQNAPSRHRRDGRSASLYQSFLLKEGLQFLFQSNQ
jgi:hypothetical protein